MKFALRIAHLALFAALAGPLCALEPRAEQARQFQTVGNGVAPGPRDSAEEVPANGEGAGDSSFGLQQILKEPERLRPFTAFADVSGYATNNVALTRRNEISDSFLVATFGLEYRRNLRPNLQWDFTLGGALFRYNQVSALNFISVNVGTGLTWHASKLWDLDFFANYLFTDLINDRQGRDFFKSNSLALGAQKIIPLSRAHYLYAGASALFEVADPASEQRFEYSAFAGYHLQATRHWEGELAYRYSFYEYTDGSRHDHNQALTVSARYALAKWLSLYGSAFFSLNRSSEDVFSYDVGNLGGGVGVKWQF